MSLDLEISMDHVYVNKVINLFGDGKYVNIKKSYAS